MELTKDSILALLATGNKHVIGRALMALTARQTDVEQRRKTTINRNGRGFRPSHAYMGTSMAGFYEKRTHLTDKQIAYWTKPTQKVKRGLGGTPRSPKVSRISIYAGQLLKVAQIKKGLKECTHLFRLEGLFACKLGASEVEKWCKKNIEGKWFINPENPLEGIWFANEADKAYCGLKWS